MAQVQMRMGSIAAAPGGANTNNNSNNSSNSARISSSGSGSMIQVGVAMPQPSSETPDVAVPMSSIEPTTTMTNTTSVSLVSRPYLSLLTDMVSVKPIGSRLENKSSGAQHTLDTSNTAAGMANTKEKTPMCLINELARFNKIQHQYHLTDEDGPAHKKTFTVLLRLGEEEYNAAGLSIKKAQHAAANLALEKTIYKYPPPKPKKTNSRICTLTPTVELNALAMKRGEPTVYNIIEPPRMNVFPAQNLNFRGVYNQRYHYPRHLRPCFVSLRVGNRAFIGEGPTVQVARHNAAEKALHALQDLPMSDETNKENEKVEVGAEPVVTSSTTNGVHSSLDGNDELKSPVSLVHEVALKRNFRVNFEVARESGPPHMRIFVTKCLVGNLVTEGEGNGKKLSRKRAAEKMLDELKKLSPLPNIVLKVRKKLNTAKKKGRNLIKEQKANPEYGQGINPISRLIQIQQAKKEKEPVYCLVGESGQPCLREFVIQVQVGTNVCTGNGPNKKLAKRAAAERLLQLLGYSRPQPQPNRSAIKLISPGADGDKNRKVTFTDGSGEECRSGRQLVPGLLLMSEMVMSADSATSLQNYMHHPLGAGQNAAINRVALTPVQDSTIAIIANELLEHGSSPTAEEILTSSQRLPSGQVMETPKQKLAYLADVLGFTVQFTDFPRGNKREFLSLVSISTNPPQVSHGAGETLEVSHDQAALTALRDLAELGSEIVVKTKKAIPLSSKSSNGCSVQNGAVISVASTSTDSE